MKSKNIKSLKKLAQRKKQIKREAEACEDLMLENYAILPQPVSNFVHTVQNKEFDSDMQFDGGLLKLALNAKRLMDMARLGIAVYNDYKK